jgi:hypothetical protein
VQFTVFMKRQLVTFSSVMLFLAAAETMFARNPKLASNSCSQNPEAVATTVSVDEGALSRRYSVAWDIMSVHGVWYTQDLYFQFYADADLVAYLTGISPDLVVLPVYSPVPVHFRRGKVAFVSTGLILESRSEAELFESIALDGGCPLAPGDAARFSAVQAKLAIGIANYSEATRSPLRCREITRPPQLRRR